MTERHLRPVPIRTIRPVEWDGPTDRGRRLIAIARTRLRQAQPWTPEDR